jgi:glycosyltransferase involved in cell wall biosynthesis
LALPSLSIVIPVYNAENSLIPLIERLHPVLRDAATTFEVILVDDGSRDASWRVIEDLHARHDWVRGMRMMRNYGQHNATLCGIRDARGVVVITMDDDLQHPPEQIPVLLAKLDEGYDVVYGSPVAERHGLWRDLASRITKLALQSVLGARTARQVSGFRALRTHLRQAFADFRGAFVSIDVLLTWSTTRFTAVRVPHEFRKVGRSNYTFFKLVIHALSTMRPEATNAASATGLAINAERMEVTMSRTSPRSRSLRLASRSSATRKAPPTIGTASRSLRTDSVTNWTITSGQLAAAISAPRFKAAFSPGVCGITLVVPIVSCDRSGPRQTRKTPSDFHID